MKKLNKFVVCVTALLCVGCAGSATAASNVSEPPFANQIETVSNGVISLSMDSAKGGAITSLKVGGTEVVDNTDLGRQIQYDLRDANLGWEEYNPTQAGSKPLPGYPTGIPSLVHEFGKIDSRTLHTITQAHEFHEAWLSDAWLVSEPTIGDGSATHPKEIVELWNTWYIGQDRLINWPAAMPALMLEPIFNKIYTYQYDATDPNDSGPWTDSALTQVIPNATELEEDQDFDENWMAWMVDDLSWGVAIYFRNCETFVYGPNAGDHRHLQGTLPGRVSKQAFANQAFSYPTPPVVIVGNLTTIRSIAKMLHNSGR